MNTRKLSVLSPRSLVLQIAEGRVCYRPNLHTVIVYLARGPTLALVRKEEGTQDDRPNPTTSV